MHPFLAVVALLGFVAVGPASSAFIYYQNYEYLSTIKLNDYNGYYGNVKLLRYSLPTDVLLAIWRLQLIATDSCPTTNAYFYLEHAGYPVISPHNRSFPQYFTSGRLTKLYLKQAVSGKSAENKQDLYLNVSSPGAGYWFSAAFVDSNDQMVKPDLLRSNCSFYLTASINLWQINDTVLLYPDVAHQSAAHQIFKIYKFMSPSSYEGPLAFELGVGVGDNAASANCSLVALLRHAAFPDMNVFANNDDHIQCTNSNATAAATNCSFRVEYPLTSAIYYLAVTSECGYAVTARWANGNCSQANLKQPYAAFLSPNTQPSSADSSNKSISSDNSTQTTPTYSVKPVCPEVARPIETFRFIGPTYFAVKYYFNSNYNRSNALLVRNDQKPYFFEFLVDLANHGGTLNFLLINNLVLDPGYSAAAAAAAAANDQWSTTTTSTTTTASTVNYPSALNGTLRGAELPANLSSFVFNDQPLNDNQTITAINKTLESQYNAAKRINNFNIADVRIMLRACLLYESMSHEKCPDGYGLVTQSHPNLYTNLQLSVPYPMIGRWYLAVWKECFDVRTNQSVPCPAAYVPYTIIQMSSDQCANDYCGDYGTCYIINSQLNVVSACKCTGGYEGYGCTDGRNAISPQTYLASVLFLTMSNLVFLLPICVALYRKWYIESLIYFYNMFFSTFYHACDQEFFSFCIFNYDGLQLADFISSYSSFVITILAMSLFKRPWKVFTFFVGLLACLSINLYDRFNYIAFVVFLCISLGVTVLTWVRVCYTKRKLYPTRKQLLKYYLPGFTLAITGLIIYSFLQTKSNYWILHSVWHMCMASSVVFFLPKREHSPFRTASSSENPKDVTTTTSSLNETARSDTSSTGSGPSSNSSSTGSMPNKKSESSTQVDFLLANPDNEPNQA